MKAAMVASAIAAAVSLPALAWLSVGLLGVLWHKVRLWHARRKLRRAQLIRETLLDYSGNGGALAEYMALRVCQLQAECSLWADYINGRGVRT